MKINFIRPGLAFNAGVVYTMLELSKAFKNAGSSVSVFFPTTDETIDLDFINRAFPKICKKFYRFNFFPELADRMLERKYLNYLDGNSIAYLWPGVSLETVTKIKNKKNVKVVIENINCHQATSKKILEDAYAYLGWNPRHDITEADIDLENNKLELADFVFAANPLSFKSLVENNVSENKILLGTYGWDPERFSGTSSIKISSENAPVFVSAGMVCVRKGAPLAMQAWSQSGIKGKLLFVGRMFDDVRTQCKALLERPDVVHMEYQKDLGAIFRTADVFLFLTLEEGGPMVTIEAMGCGLPLITTAMGAGEICRDGIEGFIVDPYNTDMVIDRIRQLANNSELRNVMSKAAKKRAMEYTWEKAGIRRFNLLSSVQ